MLAITIEQSSLSKVESRNAMTEAREPEVSHAKSKTPLCTAPGHSNYISVIPHLGSPFARHSSLAIESESVGTANGKKGKRENWRRWCGSERRPFVDDPNGSADSTHPTLSRCRIGRSHLVDGDLAVERER
jgi:hypothetical protein